MIKLDRRPPCRHCAPGEGCNYDGLSPAKGIVYGLLFSAILWGALALVVWA